MSEEIDPALVEAAEKQIKETNDFLERLLQCNLRERTIQLEIDGLIYTSTKLPASKALDLLPTAESIMRKVLFDQREISIEAFEAAFRSPIGTMQSLMPLMRDLLAQIQCSEVRGGKPGFVMPKFDEHFSGEYRHLLRVCFFSMVHNFGGPTYGVH